MGFDLILIAVIVGGAGLSAAYVRAEYRSWREQGEALRRREETLRSLHAARLSEQRDGLMLPSLMQLQGFGDGQAANPDGPTDFMERRKRQRKRVG
jgi:hypothetical protein